MNVDDVIEMDEVDEGETDTIAPLVDVLVMLVKVLDPLISKDLYT